MRFTLKGRKGTVAPAGCSPRRPSVWLSLGLLAALACAGDGGEGAGAGDRTAATLQSTDSAAVGATSPALGAPAGADFPGDRRARVVLLGTSLTAGLGLDPSRAYPALLQQKADSAGYRVDIVNAGLSGETSAGALRRAGWVLDQPAAAIVLEVGANDGLRGVNPDSTYANLVAVIAEIRRTQPAAKVLLVQMEAPTNLGRAYTMRFHDAYDRAAKDAGVPLLPFLLDGVAGNPRLNQSDGIHPNAEGSRIVANTMWTALRDTFAAIDSATSTNTTSVPPR
jgi:acyl-CoA thioesterase-1